MMNNQLNNSNNNDSRQSKNAVEKYTVATARRNVEAIFSLLSLFLSCYATRRRESSTRSRRNTSTWIDSENSIPQNGESS